MFSILALLCLLFAFGVLLYTFVWIAQLLARRADEAQQRRGEEAPIAEEETEQAPDEDEIPEPSPEELEQEVLRKKGGVMKTNATLGLILAVLACVLVTVGPLILTLSMAALYLCGQALWIGLRYFRVLVGRAAIGLAIGVGSVMLQYLALTGQLAELIPILA